MNQKAPPSNASNYCSSYRYHGRGRALLSVHYFNEHADMTDYKLPSGLAAIEWQSPPNGEKEITTPSKASDRNKALNEALEQCLLLSMELSMLRQQLVFLTTDANDTGKMLNRRVEIENHLLQCYQGSMPLPSQQDCKVLALRLGTPKEYWGDYIKQYEFIAANSSKAVH
ncbi:hypothetical protein KLER11_gp41 [Pararheinheimera phage vB_PsoM_KLER1-1]|nr:hypothetical protein KLER11_gp41 [Pararheinheimera phage vB_PsoM_KLER1-1]